MKLSKSVIFAAVTFAAFLIVELCFSIIVGDNSTLKLRLLIYAGDAAILTVPSLLVGKYWRWISLPFLWIISLFLLSNVLYLRYWGDIIPLSSVFTAANYNPIVIGIAPSLLKPVDSIFIIAPVVATISYFILKPYRDAHLKIKYKIVSIAISLLLCCIGIYGSVSSVRNWNLQVGHPAMSASSAFKSLFELKSNNVDAWHQNGLFRHLAWQIIHYPSIDKLEIDEDSMRSIAEFIEYHRDAAINDSTFIKENRDKNLIFIIVESLNAWTIGKQYDHHELTPVLSSLVDADGSISCLQMAAQINDGGSSDGQMIYNTGLLPLKNGIAANIYADNEYPSLAKSIGAERSAEFIIEKSSVFNHRRTSAAYGYDALYDEDSLIEDGWDKNVKGADDAIFDFAFNRICEMPQPFFAEITTLTMHYPFDIAGFEPAEWIDSITDDYYASHYLQTVHYTDAAIGRFLDKLKESGLYDNSVIIIASDHDESTHRGMDNDNVDNPIVFIALNSGRSLKYELPMGQVDVFPTILDIMGVNPSNQSWRGMGRSILSNNHPSLAVSQTGELRGDSIDKLQEVHRLQRAFNVSDSIIRSNYFKAYAN